MLLSMNAISDWLNEELIRTGFTQADLARKSGVSTAQIARVVNGTRGLSEISLRAIAEALGIPPETAFRVAGFLPPVPPRTEQHQQLTYLFDQMDAEKREDLLFYAEMLLKRPKASS